MPSKGNEYLVAAVPAICAGASRRRACFIVGEGELQARRSRRRRAALGLGDRLVFAGFQRDVAAVLTALDIVVFPSLWEGTPLTAFEALAMGKPIVATDADGLLDILTDGHDALVVPKRNAAALARGVNELIERPDLAERLAAGARATGAQYDIAAFVRKMERLYDLLHETSRRHRPRRRAHRGSQFPDGQGMTVSSPDHQRRAWRLGAVATTSAGAAAPRRGR